jgi:hypothetical protein
MSQYRYQYWYSCQVVVQRAEHSSNREFKQILERLCARTTLAFVEYRIVPSGTQKFGCEKPGGSQNAVKQNRFVSRSPEKTMAGFTLDPREVGHGTFCTYVQ